MALAPKKSVALQVRRQPSADVAPVLGGSGTCATASLAGEALLKVVSTPLVGQGGTGAKGTPSEVTEQPTTKVSLLSMMGWMELPIALVVPTVVGVTPPVEVPPTQAEVAAARIGET